MQGRIMTSGSTRAATVGGVSTASGTQADNVAGNTYDKYASKNPIERRMMEGFFGALDRMLSGMAPDVVVEIGAGEGRITQRLVERFPTATVVGLDLPDTSLADEWDSIDIPMLFGDATRMPFVDRSIDLVVGLEVLEHIPDPDRALADIARVCRGTAVVSVPPRTDLADRQRRPRPLRRSPRQHAGSRQSLAAGRVSTLRGRGRFDVAVCLPPAALPWTMLGARARYSAPATRPA